MSTKEKDYTSHQHIPELFNLDARINVSFWKTFL
jgi:hypothetical protein